ncbi:MarR family winged helix-turn-helix transcriptional regulator [Streptomyces albireticuli]|uniref:MarR family transcriptional regulator n=1 Tax=Streptomyces albireticuli TaxID=1940 RepID=A0A2A2DAR4_9ACTN|nr:MarR family transcriptional regulator [Streptomyces albireticuli]MCD9140765.1 MarR family transcriptional regulator [Streptomyces albireticuli]MCD9161273.1 MarR family transcriptional regulator [Streptomyces albireticuli]MCD9190669.1 MarR family transcriptional regulator [Streptomyces albireticuli]PAU48526.1 MarR family transcriptional regulator [Streptomyces albireticuli]
MPEKEQEPEKDQEKDRERLAADLAATASQLMRRLRAASPQGSLTPSQRAVLSRLGTEGPATTADLARAELVRPQSMRVILGVLDDLGLVARAPHPTDGRQVLFSLTPAGEDALASVRRSKHGWLTDALDRRLDAGERHRLAEALELLRKLTEE